MRKQDNPHEGGKNFGKRRTGEKGSFTGGGDNTPANGRPSRGKSVKGSGGDGEKRSFGAAATADRTVRFGNKKSVFMSPQKRRTAEGETRPPRTESRPERPFRHDTYQARYEDRARSAANLSRKRLEHSAARKQDGGMSARPAGVPSRAVSRGNSRPNTAKKEAEQGMRLNKFIAHSGVCSRRDADMYIASGSVQVNDRVVTEMGYKVFPSDRVRFDGVELKAEKKVYVLLNKPKNYITTTDDPEDRRTVMELVKNAAQERIYPVGRLDRTTMGLLLFTNDGELARGIMHPSSNIKKTYHAVLDKSLTANDLGAIRAGIELEDGRVTVDGVSYIPNAPHKEVGIEIHTGRNRIVRRIFEHLGYQVMRLDRVQLGPLTKKNLSRGQWRHLTQPEINVLKMLASGKRLSQTGAPGEGGEYEPE